MGRRATDVVASGAVTVAGSAVGVPDLVVEAQDVRSHDRVVRLASTVTGGRGDFRLVLSPDRGWSSFLQVPSRNLRIVVLGPEADGVDRARRVLFSSEVRPGVRSDEEFRLVVSREALEAAGVAVPDPSTASPSALADALAATQSRREVIQQASDAIFTARLGAVVDRRRLFRDDVVGRVRSELSTVTEAERASDRFVPSADEIEAVQRAAISADVMALVEREAEPDTGAAVGKVRLPGRVLLSRDGAAAVFAAGDQPVTLTEEELERVLGVGLDKPAAVYRRHLEPDPCRPRDSAECCLDDDPVGVGDGGTGGDEVEDHPADDDGAHGEVEDTVPEDDGDVGDGGGDGGDGDDDGGGDGSGTVTFDRAAAVASLLGRQASPEDPVAFGPGGELEGPLTAGGVSDVISRVSLSPGPADVPAFYDFHDLQVAFEPVWHEALDDRLLQDVEAVYDRIVESGGDPALTRIGALVTSAPVRFFDELLDSIWDLGSTADSEVPPTVASAVFISLEEWRALPPGSRTHLSGLATNIEQLREQVLAALDPDDIPNIDLFDIGEMVRAANTKASIALRAQIELLSADAERIVAHGRRLLLDREAAAPFRPTHEIIDRLRAARANTYPFRFFAASPRHRSVNFGLRVTYRQSWTPVSYQVGELVSTVPLAPKEVRRFTKRTVVKAKRSRQEAEANLISRRSESEDRSRAEAEIVARATARTNFTLSKSGTVNLGEGGVGGSVTTTSAFTRDAEQHSQSVKKEFREAILKSAEEYRSERKVEVTTEETFESELTESGEIQNPNDEIPVTFLFYELQRRFRVAEKLHALQSVVLVAQEVPAPSAIDAAWLVRYDWILNRVLLDDSFRPALAYASTTMISDDVVLREVRHALFRQRKLVEELKEDVEDRRATTGLRYAALQRQIERTAASAESGGGLFGGIGNLVGGAPVVGDLVQGGLDLLGGGGSTPSEAAQIREGAARDAFDRERREEEQVASRLQNALSTLDAMQRDYTERLGTYLAQVAQVERLSTHIVQNITHYMQAIWAHEPDDQRYLRLRNVPVPDFTKDKAVRSYTFRPGTHRALAGIPRPDIRPFEVDVDLGILDPPTRPPQLRTRPLAEVADLDRPLGFLGNYMIFPMVEANPITELMMDPYVTVAAGDYGVADPDQLGNMTLDEYCEYVCCLKDHLDDGDADESFDDMKPYLRELLRDLLQRSQRDDEEVVVPSDNLYIEALPGAHSVMERFKHLHRQIDVKAAQEQLRRAALDNVRRAQRILDADLEDPDIEAKYVFEGDGTATVVPPPGPGGGQ